MFDGGMDQESDACVLVVFDFVNGVFWEDGMEDVLSLFETSVVNGNDVCL